MLKVVDHLNPELNEYAKLLVDELKSDLAWALDTIEQGEDFTCMDKDCRNELRDKWLNNKPWRVPKKKKSSVDIKKLSESWQLFKPKVDFATFYKEFKERKEREASESEVLPRIGSCSPN